MHTSKYSQALPEILATLHGQQDEQVNRQTSQQADESEPLHVYPVSVEGGVGVLFTSIPLAEDETLNEDTVAASAPVSPVSAQQRSIAPWLHWLLLFCVILLLESTGQVLTNMFAPPVTITITPLTHSISVHTTVKLGTLLSPVTLRESQTVATSGYGHQDATQAAGTLSFYNGLFTPQFVQQGTVFTNSNGVQVATDQSVTIPASVPPVDGQASVPAHALAPGERGNIGAGTLNIVLTNGLLVKNSQFYGGQSERTFRVVIRRDIATEAASLQATVTASMSAVLQQQLLPGQALQPTPCQSHISADHQSGDAAAQVTVSVSQTCTAVVYDTAALRKQAIQSLSSQAVTRLGTGYRLIAAPQVSVTSAAYRQQTVILSVVCRGTWVYVLSGEQEQRIRSLVAGRNRRDALHIVSTMPHIQAVSITGVRDNAVLPEDPQQITLLVVEGEVSG